MYSLFALVRYEDFKVLVLQRVLLFGYYIIKSKAFYIFFFSKIIRRDG